MTNNRENEFSEKTKKEIYKNAESVCTICIKPVIIGSLKNDSNKDFFEKTYYSFGEIAHIIPASKKEGEPRNEFREEFIIKYGEDALKTEINGLLVCQSCHKIIDKNFPKDYSMEKLMELKKTLNYRISIKSDMDWIFNQQLVYALISKLEIEIHMGDEPYETLEYYEKMKLNHFDIDIEIFINISIKNLLTNDYKKFRELFENTDNDFQKIREFFKKNYKYHCENIKDTDKSEKNKKVLIAIFEDFKSLIIRDFKKEYKFIKINDAEIPTDRIKYYLLKIIWIIFVECDIFETKKD
ncbi:hypothetical protein [Spiroplasma endosymbiont of Cantharis nigra]|uniref:hypothetical protein n=1 Tax=Spiroplasma endosymbiont of Cantharis nigra TaxID=3066278 RepID=UPI0030D2377D